MGIGREEISSSVSLVERTVRLWIGVGRRACIQLIRKELRLRPMLCGPPDRAGGIVETRLGRPQRIRENRDVFGARRGVFHGRGGVPPSGSPPFPKEPHSAVPDALR